MGSSELRRAGERATKGVGKGTAARSRRRDQGVEGRVIWRLAWAERSASAGDPLSGRGIIALLDQQSSGIWRVIGTAGRMGLTGRDGSAETDRERERWVRVGA